MAHDMDAKGVKLDLHRLIEAAGKAARHSKTQVEYYQRQTNKALAKGVRANDPDTIYECNHSAMYDAQKAAECATDYANFLSDYFVLTECLYRDEIVVVKD